MYRVSIELYKHEWKFGRTRNAVGTRAAGECFHIIQLINDMTKNIKTEHLFLTGIVLDTNEL